VDLATCQHRRELARPEGEHRIVGGNPIGRHTSIGSLAPADDEALYAPAPTRHDHHAQPVRETGSGSFHVVSAIHCEPLHGSARPNEHRSKDEVHHERTAVRAR
jgi:hypothetical protein